MRILITGASGSGTTTLGTALVLKMGWNFIDTDDYYWLPTKPPYQAKRDHSSRLKMMLDELNKHEYSVVAGSIMNWGPKLEDSFDLIVFLYLDKSIRVERLKIREEKELGHADTEFLKWASEYDVGPSYGRSLTKHKKWLSERKCKIIKLEGDSAVQPRCESLIEALPNKPPKSPL
jgi:uridine kinase